MDINGELKVRAGLKQGVRSSAAIAAGGFAENSVDTSRDSASSNDAEPAEAERDPHEVGPPD